MSQTLIESSLPSDTGKRYGLIHFDFVIKIDHAVVGLLEEFQIDDGTDRKILEFGPGDLLAVLAGIGFGEIDALFRRINGVEALIVLVVEGADVTPIAFERRQTGGLEAGGDGFDARGLF